MNKSIYDKDIYSLDNLHKIHSYSVNNIIFFLKELFECSLEDIDNLKKLYNSYKINPSKQKFNLSSILKYINYEQRKIIHPMLQRLKTSDIDKICDKIENCFNIICDGLSIDKQIKINIENNIYLLKNNFGIMFLNKEEIKEIRLSLIESIINIILTSMIKNIYRSQEYFLFEYINTKTNSDKKLQLLNFVKIKKGILNILLFKFFPSIFTLYILSHYQKIKNLTKNFNIIFENNQFEDIKKIFSICRNKDSNIEWYYNSWYDTESSLDLLNIINKYINNPKNLYKFSIDYIGGSEYAIEDLEDLKNKIDKNEDIIKINERGYSVKDIRNLISILQNKKQSLLFKDGKIQLDDKYLKILNDILASKQREELGSSNITPITLKEIFGTENLSNIVYDIYKKNFGEDVDKNKLALHIFKKIEELNNNESNLKNINFTDNKIEEDNSFGFNSSDIQFITILETLETLGKMCSNVNNNDISSYTKKSGISYNNVIPNITVNVYKELSALDVNDNSIKLENYSN